MNEALPLRRSLLKLLLSAAALLAACGKSSSKIRLALNWKPDPEFGGFCAADYATHDRWHASEQN